MKNQSLSEPERKFLTICLKCYKAEIAPVWTHFMKEGFSNGQVENLKSKFIAKGYLKPNSYEINEINENKIMRELQSEIENDKKFHKTWKNLLPNLSMVFIVMLVIASVSMLFFISFNRNNFFSLITSPSFKSMDLREPHVYVIDNSSRCILFKGNIEYTNQTIYVDEECIEVYKIKFGNNAYRDDRLTPSASYLR